MISLKKYLDAPVSAGAEEAGVFPATLKAYASAMLAMANCSLDACPGVGGTLKQRLGGLISGLSPQMSREAVETTDHALQKHLQNWGQSAAHHYREKAAEVKALLLVMARTTEAVGVRDQRAVGQMNEVTARLKQIATLDDLTQIRASIVKSAVELKGSIERMTAEGKAAVDELRREVKTYQTRLEEAEEQASRDALTGVHNRMSVETLIEARIAAGSRFCVAMLDIDGFKKVNDTYGHLVGDEALIQFAAELRSACRSTDVIGRWGGDEFIIAAGLRAGGGQCADRPAQQMGMRRLRSARQKRFLEAARGCFHWLGRALSQGAAQGIDGASRCRHVRTQSGGSRERKSCAASGVVG